jgi:hypothetical protein
MNFHDEDKHTHRHTQELLKEKEFMNKQNIPSREEPVLLGKLLPLT